MLRATLNRRFEEINDPSPTCAISKAVQPQSTAPVCTSGQSQVSP